MARLEGASLGKIWAFQVEVLACAETLKGEGLRRPPSSKALYMSVFTSTFVALILSGNHENPSECWESDNSYGSLPQNNIPMHSHMNLYIIPLIPEARECQEASLPRLGSHLGQEQCLILTANMYTTTCFLSWSLWSLKTTPWSKYRDYLHLINEEAKAQRK